MSSLLLIQHKNFNFKAFFKFQKSVKGGYLSYLLLIQHKNFNFKSFFKFQKSVKGDPWQKFFGTPANFNRPLYQRQDLIRTLNIFTYYLSSLLLIQPKKFNFKALFYFQKSVKGGYLSYLLLIQHKNFNFKHIFYFLKSVKGGPLTKTFPTPANFNELLYQSQDFVRTLNIFSILFELLIIDSAQKF